MKVTLVKPERPKQVIILERDAHCCYFDGERPMWVDITPFGEIRLFFNRMPSVEYIPNFGAPFYRLGDEDGKKAKAGVSAAGVEEPQSAV